MSPSETPTRVIKGDLDSIYHAPGAGGSNSGALGIVGIFCLAKLLFWGVLIGLYYLFNYSNKLGWIVVLAIVTVIFLLICKIYD